MSNVTLTTRSARAFRKYGKDKCLAAYCMHRNGYGANSVGIEFDLTTRQADAAIDAGREYTVFTTGKE